jgi:hypothetical protein
MLEDLFGISEGAIANMLARAAEPLAECAQTIQAKELARRKKHRRSALHHKDCEQVRNYCAAKPFLRCYATGSVGALRS